MRDQPRMKKKQGMNHDEHLEFSEEFAILRAMIRRVNIHLSEKYARIHPVVTSLDKFIDRFRRLQIKLDIDYHDNTTDEQFKKQGHAYYDCSAPSATIHYDKQNKTMTIKLTDRLDENVSKPSPTMN